ncbi:hypothetical protein [Marinococcus sp. PL1-022]|uniref:hypothetical protein n=1 Tax=Marinococcus sp. PL1-022 TaxID=3095363 RepID=UPI0029C1A260|nr:hypothetical protein [Marinococcus sp. PL1-022]MDX6153931.1 hypothetical protein [Marinococcus sp. PL1-022]
MKKLSLGFVFLLAACSPQEESSSSKEIEELEKENAQLEDELEENETEASEGDTNPGDTKEEDTTTNQDKLEEPSTDTENEEKEWWAPAVENKAQAVHKDEGEEGEITTIWGSGESKQTATAMNNIQFIAPDAENTYYFLDGTEGNKKIRYFNGQENEVIFNLTEDSIADRFEATGLINDSENLLVADQKNIFKIENEELTPYDDSWEKYFEEKEYTSIERIKKYGELIYVSIYSEKNQSTSIVTIDSEGKMSELYEHEEEGPINDFYVHDKNHFFLLKKSKIMSIASSQDEQTDGELVGDKTYFLPDEGVYYNETAGEVTTPRFFWINTDQQINVVTNDKKETSSSMEEMTFEWISFPYSIEASESAGYKVSQDASETINLHDNEEINTLLTLDEFGYKDDELSEAELSYTNDFVWDGTGYLFADQASNSIRKYWTDNAPANVKNNE